MTEAELEAALFSISPEAEAEFAAIRATPELTAFLASCGLENAEFRKRDLPSFCPFLMYSTTQEEHVLIMDQMGKIDYSPVPGGNASQQRQFGNVFATFFPRSGEIQLSLHKGQWRDRK